MTPDRHALVEGFLDSTLDEAGLRLVQDLVANDAEFRRELVGAMRMHGRLCSTVHPDAACAELASLVGRAIGSVRPAERRFTARVMSRIPSRRRGMAAWWLRGPALAAAAAILVAVAGYALVLLTGPGPRDDSPYVAEIAEMHGEAIWRSPDGVIAKAAPGMRLAAGGVLETGASAHVALLWLGEETRVRLDAGVLGLDVAADGGKSLRLDRGSIRCEVATQPAASPLRIRTPQAEAVVVGTRFTLGVWSESTRLRVDEGLVRLTSATGGQRLDVAAGAQAVVAGRVCFASRPLPNVPREGLIALYAFGEGAGDTIFDVSGAGEPADLRIADPGAIVWLPGGGLDIRRPVAIRSLAPVKRLQTAIDASRRATLLACAKRDAPGDMAIVSLVGSRAALGLDLRTPSMVPHDLVLTIDLRSGLWGNYIDGGQTSTGKLEAAHFSHPGDLHLHLGGLESSLSKDSKLQPLCGVLHLVAIYDRVLANDEIVRSRPSAAP